MSPRFAKRALTSAALIGATAVTLFWMPPVYFCLQVTLFIALALSEFLGLLKTADIPVYRVFGIAMGVMIPLVVTFEFGVTESGEVLLLVFGCLSLFVLQFFRKHNPQALVGISLTLFGILYISWFLSFVVKIRFLEGGMIWVAYLLAVTKAGDIGAYA
ncbi:MAG: phosphatidate cytidylyltransferase, partial [Candidatus Omnitrophica bacterium]|nr:phosphatidate cytidylyltransferase [Candidatus Omnitrophota bacterium]